MRSCGECTLCCYFQRINEVSSPEYSMCQHCENGCKIYETRPSACKAFECLWIRQPQIPETLRPDKCGVMFELPEGSVSYVGHIVENHDGFKTPEVGVLIRKINAAGNSVVLYNNVTGEQYFALSENMTVEQVREDIGHALDQYNKREI